jgi:hypothetical protein
VGHDTLLVVDPTDLTKPYARKMEYLAEVRDGSKGEISTGYWCLTVVAASRATAQIVPLYQELYSQEAPEFESENRQILDAIERGAEATGQRGLWVMDRAGDRRRILVPLLDDGRRFLIRLRGDRHLRWPEEVEKKETEERKPLSAFELAATCPLPFRETIVRQEPGGEQIWPLRFGARPVRLPDRGRVPLYLVVVEGPWQKPLVLLTTENPGRSRRSHWRLVESYFARWRVEESIRFVKQSYQLEDIRLLRYDRLRAMVTLVLVAAYFAAVYLGKRTKLRLLHQHVLRCSKRIFGVPEFRFCTVTDGISSSSTAPTGASVLRSSSQEARSSSYPSCPEKIGESPQWQRPLP